MRGGAKEGAHGAGWRGGAPAQPWPRRRIRRTCACASGGAVAVSWGGRQDLHVPRHVRAWCAACAGWACATRRKRTTVRRVQAREGGRWHGWATGHRAQCSRSKRAPCYGTCSRAMGGVFERAVSKGGSRLARDACLGEHTFESEPACLLRFKAATSAYRVVAQRYAARSGACRVRPACSTPTSRARAMARRRASGRMKEAHDAGKLCGAHAGKAGERASGP